MRESEGWIVASQISLGEQVAKFQLFIHRPTDRGVSERLVIRDNAQADILDIDPDKPMEPSLELEMGSWGELLTKRREHHQKLLDVLVHVDLIRECLDETRECITLDPSSRLRDLWAARDALEGS